LKSDSKFVTGSRFTAIMILRVLKMIKLMIIIVLFMIQASVSFFIPDVSTLTSPDVIVTTKVVADQAVMVMDALRKASVPMTLDSALSIGVSEIFAGAVAGALSRKQADLLGDKKKDSLRTKVSSTGAFFGVSGLARGFARYLIRNVGAS
jgi:hypothetical protein